MVLSLKIELSQLYFQRYGSDLKLKAEPQNVLPIKDGFLSKHE